MGRVHGRTILDLGMESCAIVDRRSEASVEAAEILGLRPEVLCSDIDEMLTTIRPEFVIVATTTPSHWELRPLETAAYLDTGERRAVAVEPHSDDQAFKPRRRRQAEAMVRAARGEPEHGLFDLADSLETMCLIHAIFELDAGATERSSTS